MSFRIPRHCQPSLLMVFVILMVAGCSSSGITVSPDIAKPAAIDAASSGRVIWTAFDFNIDPATLDVEIVYPRIGEGHYNVTGFLIPPNCDDCIKVHVTGFDPVEKVYTIIVSLKNPTDLTGYDVRGTLLFDSGDPRMLVNVDDYTKLFDDDDPADINPFKVFAAALTKRQFTPGMIHDVFYEIKFPNPPNYNVSYLVDASWPGNQKEPYEIVDQDVDSHLDGPGLETATVSCIVRDWQSDVEYVNIDLSGLGFPGEVAMNHGAGDYYFLEISNEYGAAEGRYNCLISAKSEENQWLLYDYVTVIVDEWPEGPPVWVDTVGITGVVPGNGHVTVTYGVAVDPDIPVHYNVYYSETTPIDFGAAPSIIDADGSPQLVGGLVNGQEYHFAVRAEDALGFEDTNTVELAATPYIVAQEEWFAQTAGVINSSPVFVDVNGDLIDDVIIGSEDTFCYAFSGADGGLIWSFPTGNWIDASPAVAYEITAGGATDIVIGSYDHNVYRIEGEFGSEVWSFPTGDIVHASAALADLNDDGYMDAVVGSFDGKLYAIDGEDGTEMWSYDTGGPVYSSAALGDITGDGIPDAFVGSRNNFVHAVNGADGTGIWTFETGDWVNGSPALYDFTGDDVLDVAVTSLDNFCYVINGATHEEYFSFETGDKCWTSPSLGYIDTDDVPDIVFGSDDYKLYAVSGIDGSLIWDFESGDRIFSSAALADLTGDGFVDAIVGSDDFKLYLVNGVTGDAAWEHPTGNWIDSSPAVGDPTGDAIGDIAIGSFDGKVYLLSTEVAYPDEALLPWPKFRRDWELSGLFE